MARLAQVYFVLSLVNIDPLPPAHGTRLTIDILAQAGRRPYSLIMITVDGIEYATKEEAAKACKAFAASNPGSTFHNYAHCKAVRRSTTEAEQQMQREAGQWVSLSVTLYEWNKLYTDGGILQAHPELKGLWRQRL